jgi:hypothetical protein
LDEASERRWLWLHCNIQIVCQPGVLKKELKINGLQGTAYGRDSGSPTDSRAVSLKTSLWP